MSTLMEELTAIKAVEDKLTANKVANFAYTDHAYNNPLTEADGVASYDPDAEQNIPNASASTLQVNSTILTKGWRAQASSITRMLMNHFLGRCSYNLNKINDLFSALLAKLMAYIGAPDGLATLDEDGYVPSAQLNPEGVVKTINTQTPVEGNININKETVGLGDVANTGDSSTVANGGTQKFTTGGAFDLVASLLGSSHIFNPSQQYLKGSIVFNPSDSKMYVANQNHSGAWNSSHFDEWIPLQSRYSLSLDIRNLSSDLYVSLTPGIHIFKNNTDSSHIVYAQRLLTLTTYFNGVSFTIIPGTGIIGSVYHDNDTTGITLSSGHTLIFIGNTTINSSEELYVESLATLLSH